MRMVGITESISEWVCSWLWDRTQKVVIGRSLSDWGIWGTLGSRVPEGSVLGPCTSTFIHSVRTLIGRPVRQPVNGNIYSVNHVAATTHVDLKKKKSHQKMYILRINLLHYREWCKKQKTSSSATMPC